MSRECVRQSACEKGKNIDKIDLRKAGGRPRHVIEIHGISSPKRLFLSLKLPFLWSKMTVEEQEVPRSLQLSFFLEGLFS
jgi:hypothetical protein